MASTQMKSPEQIRMEMLVNDFGYIILQLLLLIFKIALVITVLVTKILHLPSICAILWAWVYPTKFAAKIRSACRVVSQNVSPPVALICFSTVASMPTVVGATLEHEGPQVELLQMQVKAFVKTCLPPVGFVVSALFAYAVLRLLPGCDETCSAINENLHAPPSVLEFLDHRSTPGEFPITPSRRMIEGFRELLLAKDREISSLQKNLDQEDDELAELLAQKDEEISKYQNVLENKDRKISDLQALKTPITQQEGPASVRLLPNILTPPNEHTRKLEKQFKAALACKADLQQQVALSVKESGALKKEISNLSKQRSALPSQPQTSSFRQCFEQIKNLQGQLSQRQLDAASAKQSLTAQYDRRIRSLDAQLSQRDLEAASARLSIAQYDQHVNHLSTQLSRRTLDLSSAQQANGVLQNKLRQSQLALTNMGNFDKQERLDYLESQCKKADELYILYMQLKDEYSNNLHHTQAQNQHTSGLRAQVNLYEAKPRSARQQITELSRSKEPMETTSQEPSTTSEILHQIALADKDKEIAMARQACQTLQDNLDAVRRTGAPSSAFLMEHSRLKNERDALVAKARKLENRLYPTEIKLANSQAREKTLTHQLERCGYPSSAVASSSSQDREIEMTAFRAIQNELDAACTKHEEHVTKSEQILGAALGSVEWQLEGRSAGETAEMCKNLDKDFNKNSDRVSNVNLGMRVKPLLEKIQWKLETTMAEERQCLARLEQEQMSKTIIGALQPSLSALTGLSGKRKGDEVEQEERKWEGEPGGKRQYQG